MITKSYTRLTLLKMLKYLRQAYFRYKSFIGPLVEYGGMLWDNCSQRDKDKIEDVQYLADHIVRGAVRNWSQYMKLEWELLSHRRLRRKLTTVLFTHIVPHIY